MFQGVIGPIKDKLRAKFEIRGLRELELGTIVKAARKIEKRLLEESRNFYTQFYAGKVSYVKRSGVMVVSSQGDSRRGSAHQAVADAEARAPAKPYMNEVFAWEYRKGEKPVPLDRVGMMRLRAKFHSKEPVCPSDFHERSRGTDPCAGCGAYPHPDMTCTEYMRIAEHIPNEVRAQLRQSRVLTHMLKNPKAKTLIELYPAHKCDGPFMKPDKMLKEPLSKEKYHELLGNYRPPPPIKPPPEDSAEQSIPNQWKNGNSNRTVARAELSSVVAPEYVRIEPFRREPGYAAIIRNKSAVLREVGLSGIDQSDEFYNGCTHFTNAAAHSSASGELDMPKVSKGVTHNTTQNATQDAPTKRHETSLTWVNLEFFFKGTRFICPGLWDSCCNRAFVDWELYKHLVKLGLVVSSGRYDQPRIINGSCGGREAIMGWIVVQIYTGYASFQWCFEVVMNLGVHYMLGCRLMEVFGTITDHERNQILARRSECYFSKEPKEGEMPIADVPYCLDGSSPQPEFFCNLYYTQSEALYKEKHIDSSLDDNFKNPSPINGQLHKIKAMTMFTCSESQI